MILCRLSLAKMMPFETTATMMTCPPPMVRCAPCWPLPLSPDHWANCWFCLDFDDDFDEPDPDLDMGKT